MAEASKIEWTDATFNPWVGCTKVSAGCDHCYAERSTPARVHQVVWGPHAERRRTSAANWKLPLRWQDQAAEFRATHGRRRRVFCASLADVFDNKVPPAWRADLFELIQRTPTLDWLLLTKRIGNVRTLLPQHVTGGALPNNVWLGATVCNQEEVDRDVLKLLALDARVRFLSIEPLLGPISFEGLFSNPSRPADGTNALEALNWVILGGESGPAARPMNPRWVRELRDQCAAAEVPFLFKQWGEWLPAGRHPDVVQRVTLHHASPTARCWSWSDGETLVHAGKKAAGRLLDGLEHNGFPRPRIEVTAC